MIVRKPFLRASDVMKKRVESNPKIEILYEHNTLGLYGEGGLQGAHLVKRMGEADEERYDLPLDGFFLAIGHKPNTDVFKEWLELDEIGYIKTQGATCKTNVEGVFAAGDCADLYTVRLLLQQVLDARLHWKPNAIWRTRSQKIMRFSRK